VVSVILDKTILVIKCPLAFINDNHQPLHN